MTEMEDAMKHLGDTDVVDAVDGRLDAVRESHLAGCQACRARVEESQAWFRTLADIEVPEPSPLFWDSFPARVNRAIDAPAAPRGWFTPARMAWTIAAAAVVVLMLLIMPMRTLPVDEPPLIAEVTEPMDDDIDADEAWAVVRSVAEDFGYDDAHDAGVAPRPGSIEKAAMELSAGERAELARLIEQELKQTGA